MILDCVRETDRLDYFHNISHDKKLLETFICRYAETPEELDLGPMRKYNRSSSREAANPSKSRPTPPQFSSNCKKTNFPVDIFPVACMIAHIPQLNIAMKG